MSNRLLRAYEKNECVRPESGNYIHPTIAQCVIWSNLAYLKLKPMKEQIKRCDDKLYMGKPGVAIDPFMDDHYAGKFKCTYAPDAPNVAE